MFPTTRISTHHCGPHIPWSEMTTGTKVFFAGCSIALAIMAAALVFIILDLIFDGKLADALGRWWGPKRDRILKKLGIEGRG